MKILGTGIDIVENSKFKRIFINRKSMFVNRVFSKNEIKYCKKKINYISCLSKRFAAKEAFVKALGTGFRNNINFKDIEVKNNILGKPSLNVEKKITRKIKKIFKVKNYKISLSMSDTKNYSVSSVIISQK